jgi:CubicO group peptidase (beta-lactamase class C family)
MNRTGINTGPKIDALMRAYQGAVPGACVAVLQGGAPIFSAAYGFADLEGAVAASSSTNYRIASMTKQFNAAAILLLAEQGRLSIEDPVRRWLRTLPDAADAITIRHLLTHTSGLIDFEEVILPGTSEQLRDADVLRLLEAENRVYFASGTQYRYSNSGYVLLALLVEAVSGMSFAAFLRERIFKPLHMDTTMVLEAGATDVPHRAFGYSAAGRSWVRTDQSLTSATLGDGGIYSSVDDLAKWDAALYDERLMRAQSLRLAFTPAIQTDDACVQYGFGWCITGETQWHSGESIGFRSVIVRYPARQFTVMVLTNRDEPQVYSTALQIAGIFLPDADGPRARAQALGPDSRARLLPG